MAIPHLRSQKQRLCWQELKNSGKEHHNTNSEKSFHKTFTEPEFVEKNIWSPFLRGHYKMPRKLFVFLHSSVRHQLQFNFPAGKIGNLINWEYLEASLASVFVLALGSCYFSLNHGQAILWCLLHLYEMQFCCGVCTAFEAVTLVDILKCQSYKLLEVILEILS